MIKSVGFDLDDTLIDDRTATKKAAERLYDLLDVDRPFSTFLTEWQKAAQASFKRYLEGQLTFDEQRVERIKTVAQALELGEVSDVDGLVGEYVATYRRAWSCFSDTVTTLKQLQEHGTSLALITNGDSSGQRAKLSQFGLSSHFQWIFVSGETNTPKPHPAMFEAWLKAAAVAPEEALFVGDNLNADIKPARQLGMRTLWISRHDLAIGDASNLARVVSAVLE